MYARDDEGNSALHLAVRGGHAAAARVLLEAGFGPLTRVANRVRSAWGLLEVLPGAHSFCRAVGAAASGPRRQR